ncbi:MAG TPA: nucleotidyl transferase AbiEii/AbiGii toxin family protein [Elusimicrobia bacterium]|nr:nucleotidyl transferase AbiEii/AbiGii toxin family protein [Elusimicrobiota bacterium]
MDKPKKYATAMAFRRALEDRLKQIAEKERLELQRLRREIAFDRLLARLFAKETAPWVLKGGYAMELRIKEARATRDIDLAMREALGQGKGASANAAILAALQNSASQDLGDFFVFELGAVMMDLDGAPYGGARFPVTARMDNRIFVSFHLDVGVADVLLEPLETTAGRDWLGFASIPAAKFQAISREQQFAEKLHAYTLPRKNPNTRVRDLVDMVLLIKSKTLDKRRTAGAVQATFARRKTHPAPAALEAPAAAWAEPFANLARECGLPTQIDKAFATLVKFFEEVKR